MDALVSLQFGFETVAGAVLAAGTVVLMLMLVAMGVFAYKNLRGDGIDWPDQDDSPDGFRAEQDGQSAPDGLEAGDEDDEWDYY